MNDYKRDRVTKQESEFKAPKILAAIELNPFAHFKKYSKSKRAVLDQFFYMAARFRSTHPSIATIAEKVRISERHCARLIAELRQEGIIESNYHHMRTSEYKVSDYFKAPAVRKKLSSLFSAFRWVPLCTWMLIGTPTASLSQRNVIQDNKSLVIYTLSPLPKRIKDDYMHRSTRAQVMEYSEKNPISSVILKVTKKLNLSKAGQVRLSCFPDEALEYAADKIQYSKHARDPFAVFFALCKDYCSNNKLAMNWNIVNSLMQRFNIDPTASPVRSATKSPDTPAVEKSEQPKRVQVETKRLDAYKPWVSPKPKPQEDPLVAADKIDKFYSTPEGARAAQLFGLKNPFKKKEAS